MYIYFETKQAPFISFSTTGLSPTPHLHSHLELVYIRSGSTLCHADDKAQLATAGDVFLAFPNQIHYYIDVEKPFHDIMIFSADFCADFSNDLRTLLPTDPIVPRAKLSDNFYELFDKIKLAKENPSPYNNVEIKAYMTLILCELLPQLHLTKPAVRDDDDLFRKVLSYCYANYRDEVSLENMASELGTSKSYISRLFREKLHTGFKDYVNSLRIDAACNMLITTQKSITDIAYDVGFGTPRTFNRCFMQAKGIVPGEYRANLTERQSE